MIVSLLLLSILMILPSSFAALVIKKVDMRHLRNNDIALIFDMSVYNDYSNKKESLDFRIRCDKCCLVLTGNFTTCDVAKLVGGNFGAIMPGATKVVSLLWPTVTLYNRVGYCDIVLYSYNKTGGKIGINHTIHFDTTINKETPSDSVKGLLKNRNYTECHSPDLDPFFNCTPIDCEEKYFGQRNFFNTKTKLCEIVPDCTALGTSGDIIYDYTINECMDMKKLLCQEHITQMQQGAYDNNVWEPKHNVESYANETHGPMERYESSVRTIRIGTEVATSPWNGILQGFLMIVAALAIYLCISCCTFSLMVVITKHSSRGN